MGNSVDGFTFGPYSSAAAALHHLLMFQSLAFPGQESQDWGVVWSEHGRACVLKPPTYDKDGDALALAYEWTGPVPAHPTPAKPDKAPRPVRSILEEFYVQSMRHLKTAALTHIVNPVIGDINAVHNGIVDHPKSFDFINIGLDSYGVITGVAGGAVLIGLGGVTSATGVGAPLGAAEISAGVTAGLAGVASAALLWADGRHLYLELFADDHAVKKWEHTRYFQNTERVAPLVALIDPMREASKAIGTMRELRPLRTETATAVKLATTATTAATEATDAAARMDNLAGNAQKLLEPNSNVLAKIKQQQAVRQANAAAATARAKAAAEDIARLQKKAAKLQKEVSDYFTVKVHFRDATIMRDGVLNGWVAGNYSLNNPFSNHFGDHIGPEPAEAPLHALVPAGLSSASGLDFIHHIYAAVVAVGGGKNKAR